MRIISVERTCIRKLVIGGKIKTKETIMAGYGRTPNRRKQEDPTPNNRKKK